MSRMHALKARPKRTLAALATALVAVGITAASGADFTAQTANPGNSFATGTLTMTNSDSDALFTASNLRPGNVRNGSVTITNTGSLSGNFTLKRSAPADSDGTYKLSQKLQVVIDDHATGSNEYTGTLADMGTVDLGLWTAGETHTYDFTVTVLDADNNYQGKSTSTTFTWDAV